MPEIRPLVYMTILFIEFRPDLVGGALSKKMDIQAYPYLSKYKVELCPDFNYLTVLNFSIFNFFKPLANYFGTRRLDTLE